MRWVSGPLGPRNTIFSPMISSTEDDIWGQMGIPEPEGGLRPDSWEHLVDVLFHGLSARCARKLLCLAPEGVDPVLKKMLGVVAQI